MMHRIVRRLSSAAFRVETEGALRRIVIDHPARRNALTLDMYRQLPRIAAEANGGRVALLEGVGEHFSAGSDISEFATLRADSYQAEEWDAVEIKAAESLRDLDIPLVALVRGNCYGSALNLMLMADVRVAADDATFCVPPAKLGLGYPRHLLEPLVDTVGRSAASELILTARVIDAEEARQLGLVHRVVAAGA
jgi:enoyl-CoA hydratase/carnithine racemase